MKDKAENSQCSRLTIQKKRIQIYKIQTLLEYELYTSYLVFSGKNKIKNDL